MSAPNAHLQPEQQQQQQQPEQQQQQQQTQNAVPLNVFEAKTDKGSSDLYFSYYGRIQHQQVR